MESLDNDKDALHMYIDHDRSGINYIAKLITKTM